MFPTPDVVNANGQSLSRVPRPQGPWRIGRLDVPTIEHLVHLLLVTS